MEKNGIITDDYKQSEYNKDFESELYFGETGS